MKKVVMYFGSALCLVILISSCSRDEENANALFLKADSLEQLGDFVKAYDIYSNIIELYPETEVGIKVPEIILRLKTAILRTENANILFQRADSLVKAESLVAAYDTYESIVELYPETEAAIKVPEIISRLKTEIIRMEKRILRAKLSEADASLGSIRTQLRVYYGENGEYPISADWSLVIGADWNDIRPGELTGRYFTDQLYWYKSDGSKYTIICRSSGILDSDRTLNSVGTLSGGI